MVLDLNFNFLALKKDVMSTKMYTMRLLFKQNTDYVMFLATLYKYIITREKAKLFWELKKKEKIATFS